jgi:DNA-binding CsgD family transcriptional regulator
MGRRMASERRDGAGLVEILGQAAGALIAADAGGRVIYASPAAEALLKAADGLAVRDGALAAGQPAASRALLKAIGRAVQDGAGAGLALPRPSGRRPLAVLVGPAQQTGPGERLALVSIVDPEPQVVAAERLSELFGLTLGEARVVAHLAAGYDAREIAERLGLSFHTVRTQLARALAKSDTRRQAELVALIARAFGRLN